MKGVCDEMVNVPHSFRGEGRGFRIFSKKGIGYGMGDPKGIRATKCVGFVEGPLDENQKVNQSLLW